MFICSNFGNKNGYTVNFQVGMTAFGRITMIIEYIVQEAFYQQPKLINRTVT